MKLKLEVFDTAEPEKGPKTIVLDALLLEETKLASYDAGYSAGWEDAMAAQAEDQTRIRTDFARNLQALSFTYHEARDHVLRALQPLLGEIASKLLPQLAQDVLVPTILQTLIPLAEKLGEAPIVLVINPAVRSAMAPLLEQTSGLPVTLEEEPSLSEGQVYLRLGECETQINLDRATAEISAAVRDFFELSNKEQKHG